MSWIHLGQEDLVLYLPPTTGTPITHIKRIFSGLANNLLEAMETNLIRVLINLSPLAKQNQEAKRKGGGGLLFFFPPSRHTSVHRVGPTLDSWELTFFFFFWRKVLGFHICLKLNTHETLSLNSTAPFKRRGLAPPPLVYKNPEVLL